MEADDLLAHDVHAGPAVHVVVLVVHIAQGRDVVEQGVEPHIDHMAGVEVHGDAPGEAGAGHAQVLQAALAVDEVIDHLVDAAAGLQEIGVQQQVADPAGVLGGAEEIGLLLRVGDLPAAVGALAVHELAVGPEALAGLAVLALIDALVDVAVIVAEYLLHGGDVVVVGGADEAVVRDVHELPEGLDAPRPLDDPVHELLGGAAGLPGLVLDLLPVLVGAGEEHHVPALHPLVPGEGIRGDGAVAVADMQVVRRVVDRRRYIEFSLTHSKSSLG